MKYYIDFTARKDKYNYHVISLYFDNIEDYIFNLAIINEDKYRKIVDKGISWGWTKEDISDRLNNLIGGIKK